MTEKKMKSISEIWNNFKGNYMSYYIYDLEPLKAGLGGGDKKKYLKYKCLNFFRNFIKTKILHYPRSILTSKQKKHKENYS